MPKAGFGSFEFNTAPQMMPRAQARPAAQRPGPNAAARPAKEMPMGKIPLTASGISSGMTPGMTPKAPPGDKPGIVQKNAAGSKMPGHVLDFSPNSLLNGIILSEILGKPKYLQKMFRKRW